MWVFVAPRDRAASIKVSPFTVMIWARVSRVNCARQATEMAIMVPVVPGPMMATRISAIRISGKDHVMSTTMMTLRSSQPPNHAAAAPSVMPQTTEMAMAVALTESEVRAPQISRVSRSRPNSSVPSQCAEDAG